MVVKSGKVYAVSGCSHHVIESVAHVATLIEETPLILPFWLGSS